MIESCILSSAQYYTTLLDFKMIVDLHMFYKAQGFSDCDHHFMTLLGFSRHRAWQGRGIVAVYYSSEGLVQPLSVPGILSGLSKLEQKEGRRYKNEHTSPASSSLQPNQECWRAQIQFTPKKWLPWGTRMLEAKLPTAINLAVERLM